MKKLYCVFIFCFASCYSIRALSAKVDERTELLSIVCRLADYGEFVNNQVKSYTEDIDMYFAPYANLAVINYAKEIRKSHQIAFDAIGHLVPSLEIKKGTVQFKKNKFGQTLYPLGDNRWNKDMQIQFMFLLNDFYKRTKFQVFFEQHRTFYEEVEERFNTQVASSVDMTWFDDVFGKNDANNSHVLIALCNGSHNYGASVQSHGFSERYAIIGVSPMSLS